MTRAFDLDIEYVPGDVRWIVQTLEREGFETWAVGGAIRDAILGRATDEWDFATRARPSDVQRVFQRTVPVGIDHGTVGVLKAGRMYEVTTFRRDVKPMGRRAVVSFSDTLEEDLARRDFTFNALAWHPDTCEVRDPFGGVDDLRGGVLRAVGDASARFREDYLRILRGLRFAGAMGLEVEPDTWGAMTGAVEGLRTLSWERVREELIKVLSSTPRASVTLSLYGVSGALAAVLPELDTVRSNDADWASTMATVDSVSKVHSVRRVAALFHPVAEQEGVPVVLGALERLRFSNADIDRIAASVAPPFALPEEPPSGVAARVWAAKSTAPYRSDRLRLALARARAARLVDGVEPDSTIAAVRAIRREIASGAALSVGQLAIDGKDLLRLGEKPGPRIGSTLRQLLDVVLEDPSLNTRELLLPRAADLLAVTDG